MSCIIIIYVTQSYDIEKVLESCRIGDIIQYDNNMLALWKTHEL